MSIALPSPAASPRRAAGMPPDLLTLHDGRRVRVRPLREGDAGRLQGFVRGLSAASRHARFHVGIRELTPAALHALTAVDQRCHVALIAEAEPAEPPDGDAEPAMVAEARYVVEALQGEFALVVADPWQGSGLGQALIRRLIRHAARRGLRRLFGEVLRDNAAMLALMRRLGARFTSVPGSALLIRASLELEKPVLH